MTEAEKDAIKIIENFEGDPLDLIPLLDENGAKHQTCPTCPHNPDWHGANGCALSYCHCKTVLL